MTVKKLTLAKVLQDEIGLSQPEALALVRICFEEAGKVLADGDNLHIPGIGRFLLRDKNERMGRNPKTQAPAVISARRVVVFRPGPKLKQRIAENASKR